MHLHRRHGLWAWFSAPAILVVGTLGATACSAPAEGDTSVADDSAALTGVTFHGTRITDFDGTMPDVDALAYDLDLRVDEPRSGVPTFTAILDASFAATKRLTKLDLDFDGNIVDEVKVGGMIAPHVRDASGLHVTLPRAVARGAAILLRVRYHGTLFRADGANPNDFDAFGGLMVLDKNAENRRIYESLNWPRKGRRWIPLRDHPRDGAMFAVRATFPAKYTVVGNGLLTSETTNADGSKSWQWVAKTPMPSYDFHVAAYDNWNHPAAVRSASGIDVDRYVYEKHVSQGAVMCGELPDALDWYETKFGAFRWEKASFLETPIFGGGMEHATSVSLDETLFSDAAGSRSTAFHELAHHWSGNLARVGTWNDFWLSEGFTDYLAGRFIEAHDGHDAGLAYWREMRQGARDAEASTPHALRPADPEIDVLTIFDSISYKKGALVLRMLERKVGRDPFDAFLRGWFDGHAWKAVTTSQLETELVAAFGPSIHEFFAAWVYGQGHPDLDVTFAKVPGADEVDVTIVDRSAAGPAAGFPAELGLRFEEGASASARTADVVVPLTGKTTRARVPVAFTPGRVTVDPDEALYAFGACDTSRPCRSFETCRSVRGESRSVCVPR
ncbi:MAG: M1 family metallopeptidase [Polyangiaceae bacterium]